VCRRGTRDRGPPPQRPDKRSLDQILRLPAITGQQIRAPRSNAAANASHEANSTGTQAPARQLLRRWRRTQPPTAAPRPGRAEEKSDGQLSEPI
jgi:hypothetical protein